MDNYDPDDVMPNDGTYLGGVPREPAEQEVAKKKEKAKVLEGLAILKIIVARLEQKVDYFERHSNLPDEVRTDPQKFLIMSNSYTMTADNLRAEKEYIQSLLDTHAPNL